MPTKTAVKSYKIQLTVDQDFHDLINKIKLKFPLLKEVDIIKMATSGFYTQNISFFGITPVENLNQHDSDIVETSINQLKNNSNKQKFTSGKKLLSHAKSLE